MSTNQVTMMGAGVRVAAASGVLLGGLLVAMLFRHDSSPSSLPPPDTGERLVLRKRLEPQRLSETVSRRGANAGERATAPSGMPLTPVQQPALPKAMLLKPLSSGEPPPVLAKEYPGDAAADPQDWTSPAGLHASGPKGEGRSPRVHKIADGDTLRGLAERYLGSAARFLEIYEANRGLLSSPEILPIGAALRIPARQRQGPSPSNFMPKPPLVPVSGNEDEQ